MDIDIDDGYTFTWIQIYGIIKEHTYTYIEISSALARGRSSGSLLWVGIGGAPGRAIGPCLDPNVQTPWRIRDLP